MELKDDILIPSEPSRRLSSKHILRVLAVLLVAAALAYADKILKLDSAATVARRRADVLPVIPIFLFGILLWWYAGRKMDRLELRNVFWLSTSLISGFVGLSAVTIGWIFLRYGEQLHRKLPSFFEDLENRLPTLRHLEASPGPLIATGILLVVLAGVALALAKRRRQPTA